MESSARKGKDSLEEKRHRSEENKDRHARREKEVDRRAPVYTHPRNNDRQTTQAVGTKYEKPLSATSNSQNVPPTKRSSSYNRDPSSGGSTTSPPASARDTGGSVGRRETRSTTSNAQNVSTTKRSTSRNSSSSSPRAPRAPSRSDPFRHVQPSKRESSLARGIEKLKLDDKPTGSKAVATGIREKKSVEASVFPEFPHETVNVKELPERYLPRPNSKDRLIVYGDAHGMPDAVNCLKRVVRYNPKHDLQIFGGDMITKGRKNRPSRPNMTPAEVTIEASKDVLRNAMADGAYGVRGNHEDWLLNVEHARNGWIEDSNRHLDNRFLMMKNLRTPNKDGSDHKLYDAISRGERDWLKKLPHILVLGKCGGRNKMIVVHAGLNPNFELKAQRVIETMNIKSIDPENGYTSSMHKDDKERKLMGEADQRRFERMEPWFDAWDKKQEKLQPNKRTTVIYGHESKKGLTKREFSIGLDTGVQRVDKDPNKYRTLTALVIYHDHSEIVQVKEVEDQRNGKWEWKQINGVSEF
ncbi:hypothetical protein OCU04_002204 [Sclerotinia nivalis]|uniref:Calcineurin-like phosphoesterase domain-containing protein n=1 Tax=Sclerotinia nivalis TaxID=352851 RepID=A0A9X0DRL4_9HELO|nr:hypothetical protein OCU04_002204 [Sclerotinia nivalis]